MRMKDSAIVGFIIAAFVAMVLWRSGYIAVHAPQTPLSSSSAEPFNIKTNDVLGIRLGMSLSDYRRQREDGELSTRGYGQECLTEDADTKVFCTVSPPDRQPKVTIGGVEVSYYDLTFYEQRLISINYALVSIDWDPLEKSLESKFGQPTVSENQRTWKNAVSSILLYKSSRDLTAGTLTISLDKETSEWLERSRKRRDAEAKGDL